MKNPSRGIGGQMRSMIGAMVIMKITEVGGNMIMWMFKVTMTTMINILTVVMIVMIEWMMMIIIVKHLNHMKESMNIGAQRGLFPGTTITESASLL